MDASSDEGVVTEEVVMPQRVERRAAEPWDTQSVDSTDGVSTDALPFRGPFDPVSQILPRFFSFALFSQPIARQGSI
ncbi:hypothetical protein E2C01_081906 [Portunus trituberculatus]|uniref:Uncharacterized protein n=1 Tax=Portunus trituberculatus TaxID=210409 RepID=A0A5B7J053_PORTR|nr:hypothetical protein [Portunus trituberculatus]